MAGPDLNVNALWARLIMDELHASGVRAVCVCPGSRSAMLAWAAQADGRLAVTSHIDERSAGFFALGMARATGRPVPLVCTSGSAATHLLPALVEAEADRVPMVVLSADRPAELLGCGAPQAMDQAAMFGRFVREFVNLPAPSADAAVLRYVRSTVNRAVDRAVGGGGAMGGGVHLNVPFREPLQPVAVEDAGLQRLPQDVVAGRPGAPWLGVVRGSAGVGTGVVAAVAARLAAVERALIVVGPMGVGEDASAVVALSAHLGVPLLADPLSGLRQRRFEGRVCHRYDAWSRVGAVQGALAPELILRFGASMTSKFVQQLRAGCDGVEEVVVDAGGKLYDVDHLASSLIVAEPGRFAEALRAATGARPASPWARGVAEVEAEAGRIGDAMVEEGGLWEGAVARAVASRVPAAGSLFCASSMPIRDLDAFGGLVADGARVFANRGVNGIDGQIATALGVAAGSGGPVVGLIGDVAFLHDVGSLLAARRALEEAADVTLVVIDNRGGGIFAFLPVASVWGAAEPLFTTPPGVELAPIAAAFGARVREVADRAGLAAALSEAIGRPGLDVVVVHVERDANVAKHRAHQAAVETVLGVVAASFGDVSEGGR